jgi:hypothetical protein
MRVSTVKVVQFGKRPSESPSPRSRSAPHRQWPQYKGPRHHKDPHRGSQRNRWRSWLLMVLGGSLLACLIGFEIGPPLVGCNVKANISYNGGQKIYHVPGQKYYWATRINWLKGERWFCSEMAARQAGWRRSGV